MRLLVTGGAGYIGGVTAAILMERGHEVTIYDNLSTGHRDAVPDGAHFIEADLFDTASLDAAFARGIDAVVHFAAKSLVAESMRDPALYYRNNVMGSMALLDAMRRAGTRTIIFSSTAATYGEPDTVPIVEDAATRPTNPYGCSKLAIDMMLRDYAAAYGLAAVSLRYFNVAGAYGELGERHDPETHLIPNLLRVAAGETQSASLFGTDYDTPDGTCIRDYVHVADLAEAHVLALGVAAPGTHRIYNLGSDNGHSNRDVIEAVRRVTGHPVPVVEMPRRPGDPARLVASSALARRELAWKPSREDLSVMVRDAWQARRPADASV